MLSKIFSFLFLKGNMEDILWSDDILACDFREPQGGQYLSCQENTHKVLWQMPLCPKRSISRLFRLVMEQNNYVLAEDIASKGPSNQTQLRMFRDVAGTGVLPAATASSSSQSSFMDEAESPDCGIHPLRTPKQSLPLSFYFSLK